MPDEGGHEELRGEVNGLGVYKESMPQLAAVEPQELHRLDERGKGIVDYIIIGLLQSSFITYYLII